MHVRYDTDIDSNTHVRASLHAIELFNDHNPTVLVFDLSVLDTTDSLVKLLADWSRCAVLSDDVALASVWIINT